MLPFRQLKALLTVFQGSANLVYYLVKPFNFHGEVFGSFIVKQSMEPATQNQGPLCVDEFNFDNFIFPILSCIPRPSIRRVRILHNFLIMYKFSCASRLEKSKEWKPSGLILMKCSILAQA